MATKKKPEPQPEEGASDGGILKTAAKAIGSAIGTVAAKTGLGHASGSQTAPKPPAKKRGKLESKAKKRLPRKEKKRLKKAATKQSAK